MNEWQGYGQMTPQKNRTGKPCTRVESTAVGICFHSTLNETPTPCPVINMYFVQQVWVAQVLDACKLRATYTTTVALSTANMISCQVEPTKLTTNPPKMLQTACLCDKEDNFFAGGQGVSCISLSRILCG